MRNRLNRVLSLAAVLAVACLASGCLKLSDLSEMERLFPESALSGAVARATVRDVIASKGAKGQEIAANAIIPENPKTEQLKPTGLTLLRRMKEKYPDAAKVTVSIYDDERAIPLGLTVANADYRAGSVSITGGLPTEAEVTALNSGRPAGGKLGPFAQPREEDFNIAQKVLELAGTASSSEATPGLPPGGGAPDESVERKAAAFFHVPLERVKTARFNLANWYGMHKEGKLLEKR
ncbi:MAG TPA: hypothetical protein VGK27_06340 [Candidatus Deferrimicrobiaceae bacterium]|jgi:hypothetical protein